jgi:tetratricopeptide (TPR) repeat protein
MYGRTGATAMIALLGFVAAGCAPFPVQELPPPDVREPAPEAEPALRQPQVMPPPEAVPEPRAAPQPLPQPEPEIAPSYHPAGEALVEQARREAMLGNAAAAGSTLERALRIDSANPWTWIELGYLRLEAGQDAAAESMARKALSLASMDRKAREAATRLLQQSGAGR